MRASRLVGSLLLCLAAGLPCACGSAESTTDQTPTPNCPSLVTDTSLTLEEPPNGAEECAAGDCNYQTQDGCSASLACRPQFNLTDVEVHPGCEAAGTAQSGDDCLVQADCARGLYCALGTCHKLCCGADWTACDAGESCIRSVDVRAGGEVIAAGASLCFPINTVIRRIRTAAPTSRAASARSSTPPAPWHAHHARTPTWATRVLRRPSASRV